MPLPDYYEILQVSPNADNEVIQAAYKRLVLKYHPDRNFDPAADKIMRSLNEAYETLSKPVLRKSYDEARQKPDAVRNAPQSDTQRARQSHSTKPTQGGSTARGIIAGILLLCGIPVILVFGISEVTRLMSRDKTKGFWEYFGVGFGWVVVVLIVSWVWVCVQNKKKK